MSIFNKAIVYKMHKSIAISLWQQIPNKNFNIPFIKHQKVKYLETILTSKSQISRNDANKNI